MLYSIDIFRFQISIHTLQLDLPENHSHQRKYQTMAFEKVSDNSVLLYGIDIFTLQISIYTLKLDVPKKILMLEKMSDNGI